MTTTGTAPTVTLAGKVFTIHQQGSATYLIGARGAVYYVRPYLGESTGRHEVIAMASGAPLRDKYSRAIKVVAVGDVIELAS